MDLKLKDDATPVCLCFFPVSRAHKAIFRKEVEGLVKLGVLDEENYSEWGAPSFEQPKEKKLCRILKQLSELKEAVKT